MRIFESCLKRPIGSFSKVQKGQICEHVEACSQWWTGSAISPSIILSIVC